MTKYTDCELCGREIGHWLGCEGATQLPPGSVDLSEDLRKLIQPVEQEEPSPTPDDEPAVSDDVDPDAQCARDDCTNERLPQGKGPRPKYCADHKTRSK